ncbi:hypothetical protein K504DRAFT_446763 [Pleomassaria siparia CBS 279.74]|uniref:Uncharacterized protein n=1 Tax=Pleomassaria siparia CBS 279.74 TaxID=1314801 RepID=A0A6G1K5C1_9PLEO|nr:hypothetical protein K504DRAFT_446763 [Pleomassaria siparia CBS 279.74]
MPNMPGGVLCIDLFSGNGDPSMQLSVRIRVEQNSHTPETIISLYYLRVDAELKLGIFECPTVSIPFQVTRTLQQSVMRSWGEKYESVQDSEEDLSATSNIPNTNSHRTLQRPARLLVFLLFQLIALGSMGVLGYFIGNSSHNPPKQNFYPAKAHGIDRTTSMVT